MADKIALWKSSWLWRNYIYPLWTRMKSPMAASYNSKQILMCKDLWISLDETIMLTNQFLDQWNEMELDVVIAPGYACPAPGESDPAKFRSSAVYTAMYNVLNFPVGAVPVTRENQQDQVTYK